MSQTKNDAIYLLLVVAPLERIIDDLNGKFTLKLEYLDEKLREYVLLAAKANGINPLLVQESEGAKPVEKNDYAKAYYLKYFSQLLTFFKSIK